MSNSDEPQSSDETPESVVVTPSNSLHNFDSVIDSTNLICDDFIEMENGGKPKVIYRCKKCRRIVASEEIVVPHEQGEGEKCFKWKDRDSNWSEKKPQCTAIFVQPMKWMQAGTNLTDFYTLSFPFDFVMHVVVYSMLWMLRSSSILIDLM